MVSTHTNLNFSWNYSFNLIIRDSRFHCRYIVFPNNVTFSLVKMECSAESIIMTEVWSICTSSKIYYSFLVRELVKWFTFCRTAVLKCTKHSITKTDKTVNLKVHCRTTNVVVMAYVEWSSVLLESSLDDSRSPYFHYHCLWWVTVCCPAHRIFTTPPLCENLLLCASCICCYLNVSNIYTFRGQKYAGVAE